MTVAISERPTTSAFCCGPSFGEQRLTSLFKG